MVLKKKRVDDDWKRRAEEEKQKIEASLKAEKAPPAPPSAPAPNEDKAPAAETPPEDAGPASGIGFLDLVRPLAMQAMAGLGQAPDPRTGMRGVDLEFARDHIDLLGVLERKTRGNLTAEEKTTLDQLLLELRSIFAQMAQAAAQAAQQPPPQGPPL